MISIDWTILVQFVNFLVLMAVLNVLLYRPLRNVMAQRQGKIEGGHQKARDLEASIQEKIASYEGTLKQAKLEGAQDAATLRNEAAKQESLILGEARSTADESLAELKKNVAAEAEKARKTLKNETKNLAAAIASKVLGRNVK